MLEIVFDNHQTLKTYIQNTKGLSEPCFSQENIKKSINNSDNDIDNFYLYEDEHGTIFLLSNQEIISLSILHKKKRQFYYISDDLNPLRRESKCFMVTREKIELMLGYFIDFSWKETAIEWEELIQVRKFQDFIDRPLNPHYWAFKMSLPIAFGLLYGMTCYLEGRNQYKKMFGHFPTGKDNDVLINQATYQTICYAIRMFGWELGYFVGQILLFILPSLMGIPFGSPLVLGISAGLLQGICSLGTYLFLQQKKYGSFKEAFKHLSTQEMGKEFIMNFTYGTCFILFGAFYGPLITQCSKIVNNIIISMLTAFSTMISNYFTSRLYNISVATLLACSRWKKPLESERFISNHPSKYQLTH